MEPIVLDAPTDLATETASQLSLGRDHGVGVSFFMNHTAPGGGHGFRNTGAGVFEMTSLHVSAEMDTEWVEA